MNDGTNRGPGAGDVAGGDRDNSDGTEVQTSGSSDSSIGSGSDVRDRRRPKSAAEQRVRWVGIASSIAALVFILAQMYGTLTGNKELTEKIQEKVPSKDLIEQLGDAVGQVQDTVGVVQDTVENIPAPVETTIIQKGEPGQPGQPGAVKIIRTAPNTVVVTTAAPVPPGKSNNSDKPNDSQSANKPTPKPQPTCATTLFGACIIP